MKKTSDGKSYLEYLYPGWTDWRNAQLLFNDLQAKSNNADFKNLKFENWEIDLSNPNGYAIIAQIAPIGYWKSIAATATATGIVVVGVVASATYVGAPVGISLIATGVAGVATAVPTFWYTSPGGKFVYVAPAVYPYDLQTLQNMGCNSFETAP